MRHGVHRTSIRQERRSVGLQASADGSVHGDDHGVDRCAAESVTTG